MERTLNPTLISENIFFCFNNANSWYLKVSSSPSDSQTKLGTEQEYGVENLDLLTVVEQKQKKTA